MEVNMKRLVAGLGIISVLFGLLTLWSSSVVAGRIQSWEGSSIRLGNGFIWNEDLSLIGRLPENFQVVKGNHNGRIAGNCEDQAVVFDPDFDTVVILSSPENGRTCVMDMNDHGVVVGAKFVSSVVGSKKVESSSTFLWKDFKIQNIGSIPPTGGGKNQPIAINNHGQVLVEVHGGGLPHYYAIWDGIHAEPLFPNGSNPSGIGPMNAINHLIALDIFDDGKVLVARKASPNRYLVYLYDRKTDTALFVQGLTDPLCPSS
jgi:hypothetical protein